MITQDLHAAVQAHVAHGAMEQEDPLHSSAADAACAVSGSAADEPPPELVEMWGLELEEPIEMLLLYAVGVLGGIALSHLAAIGW